MIRPLDICQTALNKFRSRTGAVRCASLLVAATLTAPALSVISGCAHKQPSMTATVIPINSFVQAWQFPLNFGKRNDSLEMLYLRGGTLFAISRRNTVVSLNPQVGTANFIQSIQPDSIALKAPIPIKDRFAFASGNVIEVLEKNGKKSENVTLSHSMRSGGVATGDSIYVGLDYPGGGRLGAVDLTRKFDRERWELLSEGGISATPGVHQNVIYYAGEDGRVVAVGEDRLGVWPLDKSAFHTDGPITADVMVDDTGVYVASNDTKLYCIDLANGKLKWQYYAGTPLTKAPSLTQSFVYLPVPDHGVVALAKTEGKYNREAKWTVKSATQFLSEDEKFAYLLGAGNHIIAVDKINGQVMFHSKRSDLVVFASNPNPKDSTIYGATRDGLIIAIKPVTRPGAVGELVSGPQIHWVKEVIALND